MKFEEALKRLEEIVAKIEGGGLSLDGSLKAFEEGVRLSRFLNARLEEAEGRVEKLLRDRSGALVTEPFDPEAEPSGGEKPGSTGTPDDDGP